MKVQNHVSLRRLPRNASLKPQRSTEALASQVQQDNGGNGYENVTQANRFAVQYSVQVVFNEIPMELLVDSGSPDTRMLTSIPRSL